MDLKDIQSCSDLLLSSLVVICRILASEYATGPIGNSESDGKLKKCHYKRLSLYPMIYSYIEVSLLLSVVKWSAPLGYSDNFP